MKTFTYQNLKKTESEQRIINALSGSDKSYSELLNLTDLSKPIQSERLKSLEKQGKIRSVAESKTKRFLYHLEQEKLNGTERVRIQLYDFSMLTLSFLESFVKDETISDDEYAQKVMEGISLLLQFKVYEKILAPSPEREEWIRILFGPESTKRLPLLLFPENRNTAYILTQMSPEEQALFKSKNARETATELLKYLNAGWEKMGQRSKITNTT